MTVQNASPARQTQPRRVFADLLLFPVTSDLPDEEMSTMTTALAHEVRNPLTNINLSVKMLLTELKDPELKKYVNIIQRCSTRINDLITQFLRHQQREEPVECSLRELLEEALVMTKDRISLQQVTVTVDFAAPDRRLLLKRPEMILALNNIILNAIEAMPPGTGELSLATKSVKDKLFVLIEDNGCGISQENMQHMFKPHVTGKVGGTGMGLAAAYDILRSNQVGIDVESREGKGTRFLLKFERETIKPPARPPKFRPLPLITPPPPAPVLHADID